MFSSMKKISKSNPHDHVLPVKETNEDKVESSADIKMISDITSNHLIKIVIATCLNLILYYRK